MSFIGQTPTPEKQPKSREMGDTKRDFKIEIENKDFSSEVEADYASIVRSPRDVEFEALLHPGNVETFDDLVRLADDGIEKTESEDYRHAFIPYYG